MRRCPCFNSKQSANAQARFLVLICALVLDFACAPLAAQTGADAAPEQSISKPGDLRMEDIEQRLNAVTATLSQTQQALQQSLLEIQQLRGELDAMKLKAATSSMSAENPAAVVPTSTVESMQNNDLKALHEQQDALQAEIAQHEQTKVETSSKYSLRINGLVLFNAFSNAGVVDDADLPTIALPRFPGTSHGSLGATVRQTLLGFDATGPRVWNARSSARLSVDFFGGVSTNEYGYSSPTGLMRMRQADASLDWERTTAQVGITEPLITPLSPTSYATVAMPALSASGNLWAWSPQLRVEQRIPFSEQDRLTLEAGLIDPESPSYTSVQLDTPVEASRRPGYEGRIAFHADGRSAGDLRSLAIGVGAYSSNQYYAPDTSIHSWAVTADWQIPLFKFIEISGEAYRGRALGGFGGGAYKDVLMGADATTGLSRIAGVDAVGGWSQAKLRFTPTVEVNGAWGIDDALSSNFDGLVLSTSTNPLELNARNSSLIGNFIFRPKTYLIFSPEYRRIESWRYEGSASIANIFTLTAGFQF
jgi:hypothetical protein